MSACCFADAAGTANSSISSSTPQSCPNAGCPFPTLIALITIFFAAGEGWQSSLTAAFLLLLTIVFSVLMTLWVSRFLSATILKGTPSAFSLELPPYRRPRVGQVLLRSVLDRTLFVLARAAVIAAPAGLLIWLMANIDIAGLSLLARCADFLEPLGQLMGLDGMILLAFLLGLPANEIVIPVLLMGYLASGSLTDYSSLTELQALLTANGWTAVTALCTMAFSLFHFPCGTTCLTIWRETKSLKWTVLAILLPTLIGAGLCIAIHQISILLW